MPEPSSGGVTEHRPVFDRLAASSEGGRRRIVRAPVAVSVGPRIMSRPVHRTIAVFAALAATWIFAASAAAVAPVVSQAIPDTTVAEDSPLISKYRDLNKIFLDAEDGDSLAFVIVDNSNPGLLFASIGADSALDLSFAPNASGSATLVLRATDSEALFVEDTFTVTVTPVNDLPVVSQAIPDTTVAEDSPPVANYRDLNQRLFRHRRRIRARVHDPEQFQPGALVRLDRRR